MASNPWLAGVNVSKCPVCDVRLLNGSCIDHGPPAAEEVEDLPEDSDEPAEPETQPGDPEEPTQPTQPAELEDKPEEKPEDKPEESQKKRRRKKTIVDTDSEDTPASSSADKQTEPPPKGDEAAGNVISIQVISAELARKYRKEVKAQRSNYGNGAPLPKRVVVWRLVKLRRRNETLAGAIRANDKKRLDELEAALPQHIIAEADRTIATVTQVTQEVRDVGKAVASLQWDLAPVMAFVRGEATLDDSMSLEQQRAVVDLQLAALIIKRRTIAAAMKEEKAATKAVAKAAAKAVAKPRGRARA